MIASDCSAAEFAHMLCHLAKVIVRQVRADESIRALLDKTCEAFSFNDEPTDLSRTFPLIAEATEQDGRIKATAEEMVPCWAARFALALGQSGRVGVSVLIGNFYSHAWLTLDYGSPLILAAFKRNTERAQCLQLVSGKIICDPCAYAGMDPVPAFVYESPSVVTHWMRA